MDQTLLALVDAIRLRDRVAADALADLLTDRDASEVAECLRVLVGIDPSPGRWDATQLFQVWDMPGAPLVPVRVRNALEGDGRIETLGDLKRLSSDEILDIRNIGVTSLRQIHHFLAWARSQDPA